MKRVLVDFSEEEWQVIVVRRKTKCWRSLSVTNNVREKCQTRSNPAGRGMTALRKKAEIKPNQTQRKSTELCNELSDH